MLVAILLLMKIFPLDPDPAGQVTPLHVFAVVDTTTLLLARPLTIALANVESMVRSTGSINQIPPLPALMLASIETVWPDVSI